MILIEGMMLFICMAALILSVYTYIKFREHVITYDGITTDQSLQIVRLNDKVEALQMNTHQDKILDKLNQDLKIEREESLDSIF